MASAIYVGAAVLTGHLLTTSGSAAGRVFRIDAVGSGG
jgi:hypothetical protein